MYIYFWVNICVYNIRYVYFVIWFFVFGLIFVVIFGNGLDLVLGVCVMIKNVLLLFFKINYDLGM